ncbi:MAG: heme ABC exporter ATP-binding protein CcmA [Candidatus Latescibacterota bacterium]|nr:heme ABC exporter ATP-binding protein CcmA [Candidatus Latescibacterota bacterium]MEC8646351.1 heme ABC exporter ATP-binding protein CcmA [Candidatus Latescibacterota bacterium]MEE2626849.1 heme ABC exporter ATP-binding protein CcmA [Candidatus Latescibacterota bacterium]MEE2726698.1 heme ABC exporter ATP-binding protein CcmA [Candidatus Latescibacterota bacterium]
MPDDGLVIENASKHFASFIALQSVHLCVERGQFVLLAGANGAGKSTLLRLMAGISRPSSGRVLIDGKDPQRDAAARSAIGFLSHHTLLYDDLSAEENLVFFARIYALESPRQRVDEALERVGLSAHRHRRLRTFSRGMRQRLALARATLHNPAILLLDEPFTGLDQPARAALTGQLRDLKQTGHTCVMVTHNPEEGADLADRLVVLRRGCLCHDQAWKGSAADLATTCAPFWDGLR